MSQSFNIIDLIWGGKNNTNNSSKTLIQLGESCQCDAPFSTNILQRNSYKHRYSPT